MRTKELTEIDLDRPTALLLNGGGQQPYNKFHKITKLFKKYNCNIVSIELPGHGKSGFDHVMNANEMLERFYQDFVEVCNRYNRVGLFGFSLGALLSLKAAEQKLHPFRFIVATGAGLKISKNEEEIMQKYASLEFFEEMRWMPIMKRYHGDTWQYLLESLSPMLAVGSELFVDDDFTSDYPLHLIIGENDGVVDYKLQEKFTQQETVNMHMIENIGHFDYFTKGWTEFQETMNSILEKYLDRI